MSSTTPSRELKPCPFCAEADFDNIGLKLHLMLGRCAAYNDTPTTDRPASLFGSGLRDACGANSDGGACPPNRDEKPDFERRGN